MQIVRIDGEQMNLFPGRLEENLRGGCGEPRALLDRDLAGRVANVVAEDLASQALGARRLAPLRDRLHDFELGADPDGPETGTLSRRGFVLIGWPVPPPRTA